MIDKDVLLFRVIFIGVVIFLAWLGLGINKRAFKHIRKVQMGLHVVFFEKVVQAIIIIFAFVVVVSAFGDIHSISKTLLGGTAVASAVLAFAAQDVIKDVLAGLMISIYKPFEIGNRIELADGTIGVVKDITMRHVVLQGMDSQCVVIPNSELNTLSLKNFNYQSDIRAVRFDFHIGYGSDIEKAMDVILEVIKSSEFTLPGKHTEHGDDYAPVYFMAFEDSSLKLSTTVYVKPGIPSERVISAINLGVNKALNDNDIEIPFNYVNVINK